MSNVSNFTGKFRGHKPVQSTKPAKVRRRPRESAVCKQCRTSKLRCDRGRPACGNCVKRDVAEQCEYDHSVNLRPTSYIVEDRLAHLESLVKELMQSQPASVPQTENNEHLLTPAESPDDQPVGKAEDDAIDETDYVGFTHWSAILNEIDGLKTELNNSFDAQELTESLPSTRSFVYKESIFGSQELYSLHQIIEENLPKKTEVDRLLSIHFQGEHFILPCIHTYHFQTQYQQFWVDTANVNPLWLSILFSILHLAVLSTRNNTRFIDSKDEQSLLDKFQFHTAAGQCLVVGEYHRPQEFAVEALVMYAHCASVTSLDPQRETGMIHNIAVRSAYQLGYHRDPDLFKTFSPFEGEMRRRSWAVCKQLDLMTSFQLGLPSSICLENCDTKPIRNLKDTDFGPDSQELPASRPDEEVTRLLWFVVKDRQMASFAKVCRDALSHKEKTEAEIQELDHEIRYMQETIPDVFKTRPISDSTADEPFIIVTRIYLNFISLKSLCVLHRRYMARGDYFSTISCLEAGKNIVHQFVELYRELAPGGRLMADRWMLGCYTMNDFLLGTTVMCLFLHSQSQKDRRKIPDEDNQKKEVLNLLKQALDICIENSGASKDAQRVARIVRLTLHKSKSMNESSEANQAITADATLSSSAWDADPGAFVTGHQQSNNTLWEDDPFGIFQPFLFAENGMVDMDWAMFDPAMSMQGV